ncbi:nucleolar protein 12-domain-containing protein [Russula aff. rugulosa BPL654]|nr:nucleolar protein 12-domain-containing protein [Russula aff. rugulosa BPL654]
MASNVDLLTQSYKVVKAKKRTKLGKANPVVFDEDARREFLTGFHKRKLAKKEESKKRAQAREKEERLEARREQRRMLAEQAIENAARVEEAYGGFAQHVESDQESWTGIAAAADIEREHEYSDEEQLATVTVVEDFDPSVLRHYSTNPDAEQQQQQQQGPLPTPQPPPPSRSLSREKASRSDGGSGAKNVNVKVRYETKAARKATRATQRARRTEKAERAGGKAARKKAGGSGGGGGGKKSRARKK